MKYTKLGNTSVEVSRICLGTMTFGEQNLEPDAHKQLDFAIDNGINFIDSAEMYPIPMCADTQGTTEVYIGNWLRKRGKRDDVILATKITGASPSLNFIRDGKTKFNREHIRAAIEGSLKRLQTDYIDLYQLHWPERLTNNFGRLGYTNREESDDVTSIQETLEVLRVLVDEGKIRYVGISNETPWGVMQYLKASENNYLPRIVSIQNPYSLLNRSYEIGLAEFSHRENISLLAYSPLGFGVLSGKYMNGQKPKGSRRQLFERYDRYSNAESERATEAYVQLARESNLDPAQMALAYLHSRPFVTSTIIGATTMTQLKLNIQSMALVLNQDVIDKIESIHRMQPNPSP